ncbi:MAG: hypothetical protein M3P22_01145 [bacterium]|nr:hypothetical protein [bacterium]
MTQPEPQHKKISCPYCGDAKLNHTLAYINNTISSFIEPSMYMVVKHSPNFVKKFVDIFIEFLMRILLLLHIAKLSNDIDGALTFRSRVIWEEAQRRRIQMEQIIIFGKKTETYRAKINDKYYFFNSLPVPSMMLDHVSENWDNKYFLKKELDKINIPVPKYKEIGFLNTINPTGIFNSFIKPIIVKPRSGSRGRHTTTNIHTLEEFKNAIGVARVICPTLLVEEHLHGYICRATVVDGKLAGFYRAEMPYVVGDGMHSILELVEIKNKNRPERISAIEFSKEMKNYIARLGFDINDVLLKNYKLLLTHRTGRLFGGYTKEMLDELHPSFIPIIESAAERTGLAIAGFDCIVPDPFANSQSQRWGIIECNTLPFIDLHYYAYEGIPKNIAGMIWDLWKK